jgi:hypothetical protein
VQLLAPAASSQDAALFQRADMAALEVGLDPAVVAEKRGLLLQGLFARGGLSKS